jgi:hypothetical protein
MFHDLVGDVAKLAALLAGGPNQHLERLVGVAVLLGDQDALGLFDRGPRLHSHAEMFAQVAGVPRDQSDGRRGREPGSDALVVVREGGWATGIAVEGADGRVAGHQRQGKAAQDAMGGGRLSEWRPPFGVVS